MPVGGGTTRFAICDPWSGDYPIPAGYGWRVSVTLVDNSIWFGMMRTVSGTVLDNALVVSVAIGAQDERLEIDGSIVSWDSWTAGTRKPEAGDLVSLYYDGVGVLYNNQITGAMGIKTTSTKTLAGPWGFGTPAGGHISDFKLECVKL